MSVFRKSLCTLSLWAICGIDGIANAQSAHVAYTITDLGMLSSFGRIAHHIDPHMSSNGQGRGMGDGAIAQILQYDYSTVIMHNVRTAKGKFSTGSATNNKSQIAGYWYLRDRYHAFLYHDGKIHDIGTLGGKYSYGLALNNSEQVTGQSDLPDFGGPHAFFYSNGKMHDIGTLGGTQSFGYGINDAGQITGRSDIPKDKAKHAFLYSRGAMKDLGTLGGLSSYGACINNKGQVAGQSDLPNISPAKKETHLFVYTNGKMIDLGTLGGKYCAPSSINDKGQITGSADTGDKWPHAFIYNNGTLSDLNTLIDPNSGWRLIFANGINNQGQIVGLGEIHQRTHSFLLTPIKGSVKQ